MLVLQIVSPGATTVSTDGSSITTPRRSSTRLTTSNGIVLVFVPQ